MSTFTLAMQKIAGLDHEPAFDTAAGLLASYMTWWGLSDKRVHELALSMLEFEAKRFEEMFPHLSGHLWAALAEPKRRQGGE